jgi:hypothetical protein
VRERTHVTCAGPADPGDKDTTPFFAFQSTAHLVARERAGQPRSGCANKAPYML